MIKLEASFDDGSIHDVRVGEIMADFPQIKTTFYWPFYWGEYNRSNKREPLTEQQADALAAFYEVGSHGMHHYILTRVDPVAAESEIVESKRMLSQRFNRPITKFCYPRGYANDQIRQFVRSAGYEQARNTLVGVTSPAIDPIWTPTSAHIGVNRAEYGGRKWYTYALDQWHNAANRARSGKPTVYHIWGHSWELEKNKAWDEFKKLLITIGGQAESLSSKQ